jgi:hypothetical protein
MELRMFSITWRLYKPQLPQLMDIPLLSDQEQLVLIQAILMQK